MLSGHPGRHSAPDPDSGLLLLEYLVGRSNMPNSIVYAVPFFYVGLVAELLVCWKLRKSTFNFSDSMTSMGLGLIGQIVNVFVKAVTVGIYAAAYKYLAVWHLPAEKWWTWAAAILLYDFFYYWNHRLDHEVNALWASHVVHHSSEEFNYSTAMRQTSTGFITGWLFYIPMAIMGIPVTVFAISAALNLFYQFWIHTKCIGQLGWFDRWFASPSNHRVHHGQNDYCVDKNYGGILMLWDRMFGTFTTERPEEEEKIVFGIHGQLKSFNPIWANLHKYHDLYMDAKVATNWKDRLLVWFKPPGWRPANADVARPKPAYSLDKFNIYRPKIKSSVKIYCLVQALLVFVVGSWFIGFSAQIPVALRVELAVFIVASIWVVSNTLENRPNNFRYQLLWLASLVPCVLIGLTQLHPHWA
ncbi:sterol desaturase family protein [Paraburkholderia sediminicola]|uniref:sterol desaturase family protein n=1 Tax=Paraburkholderia sediminicola TaxID=458836 RepID=UPI0038BBB7CD